MHAVDAARALTTRRGRSLLEHCWGDGAHASSNHTGGEWMRFIAWLVMLCMAVVFLIVAVKKWPPPQRVFPRRKPLMSVPWCLAARLLGYGVFDWRTGKLTPWWDFIKERHEILNIFAGDAAFITQRGRFAHLATELASTAAASMVLTDLTSARVSGGFWTNQIWVFVLLLTYDIVLGIALRLATLGATKVSFEAAENVGFMCAESGEIQDLEDEEQLIEMGIKASHAFNLTQYRLLEACVAFSFVNVLVCSLWAHLANPADGCGDAFNTFVAYIYVFGLYQGFSLTVISPFALTVRWCAAAFLITRIDEVQTPEETMDCCWKHMCPRLCGCRPPLVTPLEQRTVSKLFMSPRKDNGVMTGNIVKAAAVVGKSRYDAQDSPLTPRPESMNRDVESGSADLFTSATEGKEDTDDETPENIGARPQLTLSPSEKYAIFRRQASLRKDIALEDIDCAQYPDGDFDHRPSYELGHSDQIAGESAFAAARMALISAGKLTPEQVVRTRDFKHDWSARKSRYDSASDSGGESTEDSDPELGVNDKTADDVDDVIVRTDVANMESSASPTVRWSRKLKDAASPADDTIDDDELFDEELDSDPWGDGSA